MYKCELIGNLSTNPVLSKRSWENERVDKETGEIVKGKSDANVCNFTVAANEGYGSYRKTMFFKANAWRGLADVCNDNLTKGRQVYIEGVPSLNNYVDKNNNLRSSIEIRVDKIEFLQDGKRITATEEEIHEEESEEALY